MHVRLPLAAINRCLRRVGLLLVLEVDDGKGDVERPTVFHLIRSSAYPMKRSAA